MKMRPLGDSVPKPLGFTAFPLEWRFSLGGSRRPAIPAARVGARVASLRTLSSAQVRSV